MKTHTTKLTINNNEFTCDIHYKIVEYMTGFDASENEIYEKICKIIDIKLQSFRDYIKEVGEEFASVKEYAEAKRALKNIKYSDVRPILSHEVSNYEVDCFHGLV